ncbi:hypothetical protein [Paenibacillus tyrfis]|uniref:Uncharacterized protein n=1 Tax=Paenibacillus tyrfis TaxID=1501230 RepID=A0A081P886_9BACL|nr:hypothetical protein [Paenibacillus tyrfis]KEQ26909.1 hypothetical protein ET33_29670 [Paenibacillus tyrfis]
MVFIILSLVAVAGCNHADTAGKREPALSFGGISTGASEEEITGIMGKPSESSAKDQTKEIHYIGANGPNATFVLVNNRLVKGYWYPSVFDAKVKIPITKEDLDLSKPHKLEQVDCYETAKCDHYVFEQGKQKLQITMDWENKRIDRVILE